MCPIIKSAKKTLRQSLRRRVRNIQQKKRIKNLLKEVKNFVSQKKPEEAKKILPRVYKYLDKAAKTNLIKRNTVARTKSRITKLIFKARQ